jgi:hypothetical protein
VRTTFIGMVKMQISAQMRRKWFANFQPTIFTVQHQPKPISK